MIAPVILSSFREEMTKINKGLFVIWDSFFERFQIMHRDPRTGLIRCIIMVEEDDGSFRPCDNRTLDYLRHQVGWETMERYPRPEDMGRALREKAIKRQMDEAEKKRFYRKCWNREHKKYWRAALENARRGVLSSPPRTKETIISASGLSPRGSAGKKEVSLFDN